MMEELKPCPFCGEDAELDTQQPYRSCGDGQWQTQVSIYCIGHGECPAHMSICREDCPGVTTEHLVNDLIGKWNTRPVPDGYALIELKSVLTPKGEPMPQTIDAWQYLASKYDDGMLEQKEEIAKLKSQVNNLRQKLKAKEGYALVPVDPTDGMTFIGQSMRYESLNSIGAIYKAMIEAAKEQK
jgi:hypothetical protein